MGCPGSRGGGRSVRFAGSWFELGPVPPPASATRRDRVLLSRSKNRAETRPREGREKAKRRLGKGEGASDPTSDLAQGERRADGRTDEGREETEAMSKMMSTSQLESAKTPELEKRAPVRARATRARRVSGRARREGGPAGFGGRLASARDRQHVRERNAAERARVEAMLAAAPIDAELRTPTSVSTSPEVALQPSPSAPHLRALSGSPAGCPVCASGKVVRDDVFEAGTRMRLSECLHCEHRWTTRPRARWSELGQRMTNRGSSAVVRRAVGAGARFAGRSVNAN